MDIFKAALLQPGPPENFALQTVQEAIKPQVWRKRDGCLPFEKPSIEKKSVDGARKRPRWRLGNKELSQLWKWIDQNPNALTDPERVYTRAISDYWKPLAEDFTDFGIKGVVPVELLPPDLRSKYQVKPGDKSKHPKKEDTKGSQTEDQTPMSENDGKGGKANAAETEATQMDTEEADGMSKDNPNNATQVDASILEENQTQGSDDEDDEAGQIEPDNEAEAGIPDGEMDAGAAEGDQDADL